MYYFLSDVESILPYLFNIFWDMGGAKIQQIHNREKISIQFWKISFVHNF